VALAGATSANVFVSMATSNGMAYKRISTTLSTRIYCVLSLTMTFIMPYTRCICPRPGGRSSKTGTTQCTHGHDC